jgi:hypothetical protein
MEGKIARVATAAVLLTMLTMGAISPNARADEPIVGLWQATWTDANTNAVVANLWDVWHSDRTEAQNDSGPVIAGFVCQGVWIPLGGRTYGLSHPFFNYTGADGHLDTTSSSVVYEKVTVAKDSKSFAGTGIIKVFSGINPFDPSATLLSSENIKVAATRVTVDPSQLP